jgi:HK97 family phage major capsid protein
MEQCTMSARPTDIVDAVKEMGKAHEAFTENYKGAFESLRERVETLECNGAGPGKVAADTRQGMEHKSRFTAWLRKPHDSATKQALGDFESHVPEIKALSVGSSADGGYAVPEELLRNVEKFELKLSPVRNLVNVVPVGSSDFRALIDIGGTTSGWVGESDSRTATNTPQLREIVPTQGELYAYPQASNWSLDDIFFNVENWLTESVADAFSKAEGIAVLSGNGTNKPTGMTNTAPVSTADDAVSPRAAAAYQYILSGDNSPAAIDGDSLFDLVYAVNSAYRANGTFVMNSATAGAVRKLKDSGTGAYVWQPGLVAGQPNLLCGYPVQIWEDMPDIAGGALPIAFGDFRRGYMLVDRQQMRVTVDPYTSAGFTKFYVRRRLGGIPANNNAVKFLKCL